MAGRRKRACLPAVERRSAIDVEFANGASIENNHMHDNPVAGLLVA